MRTQRQADDDRLEQKCGAARRVQGGRRRCVLALTSGRRERSGRWQSNSHAHVRTIDCLITHGRRRGLRRPTSRAASGVRPHGVRPTVLATDVGVGRLQHRRWCAAHAAPPAGTAPERQAIRRQTAEAEEACMHAIRTAACRLPKTQYLRAQRCRQRLCGCGRTRPQAAATARACTRARESVIRRAAQRRHVSGGCCHVISAPRRACAL
jgi:hypothetical protein